MGAPSAFLQDVRRDGRPSPYHAGVRPPDGRQDAALRPLRRALLSGRSQRGPRNADLFIRQIAGRIGRPKIPRPRFGARTEIAVAPTEVLTFCAAPLQQRFPILQPRENRMRHILPDVAEFPLAHIAERVVLRELVGMHIAERIDLTERDAGAIAAVCADQLLDLLCPRVISLRGAPSDTYRPHRSGLSTVRISF